MLQVGSLTKLDLTTNKHFKDVGTPISSWTFLKAPCISHDGMKIAGTAQQSFGSWVTFVIDLADELGINLNGDLNIDNSVDVLDVVMLVSYILDADTFDFEIVCSIK